MKIICMLIFAVFLPSAALADYKADKKKYDDCVAKVKKDYPVPPGNVNARNQMIRNDCGTAPTPPKKP